MCVVVILTLAVTGLAGGRTPPGAPAQVSTDPAVPRLSEGGVDNARAPTAWEATARRVRLEIAAPSAAGLVEHLEALAIASAPYLPAAAASLTLAPYPPPSPTQLALPQLGGPPHAPVLYDLRAEMQAAPPAQAPPAQAAAAPLEPFRREIAKCDQAPLQSVGVQATPVLTFTYTNASNPATTVGPNYTGPGPDAPQVVEPGLELCLTLTPIPNVSLFADLTAKAPSDSASLITIDRLYLDLRQLGLKDLRFRVGRDRVALGPLGLLLNEVDLEDQRDGFQLWLPAGPVRLFGLYQYALVDRSTSRRLWGGRAEAEVIAGWTLGVNYRADTADSADGGPCPSVDCATGSGFGVDLEGKVIPGLTLTLAYVSYTQTGDVPRAYYQAELAIDLKDLGLVKQFDPVLTLWYKNFDPYTLPGSDGTVPRGGFLTPDDFKTFNINDNLTAVGAALELQLSSNLTFLAVGEWGTYKHGGPTYSVYSVGLEYIFDKGFSLKLTYNAYTVAGGSVETSPVSGIELSNTTIYQLEFTKVW